ncbi:MAG: MerR family transcriptional regulator [Burkholderiaceae bacterium]
MSVSPSPAPKSRAARPAAKAPAKSFTITELAAEFDVTPRAIRFYEDVGLLEPGRAGRNRVYSQRERTRLMLTLRGKRLGLSLQEIKQLVDMYDSPSDTVPQLQAFLEVLRSHRRQLELQMEDIRVTLAEIAGHEQRCERLLQEATAEPAPAPRARARA